MMCHSGSTLVQSFLHCHHTAGEWSPTKSPGAKSWPLQLENGAPLNHQVQKAGHVPFCHSTPFGTGELLRASLGSC